MKRKYEQVIRGMNVGSNKSSINYDSELFLCKRCARKGGKAKGLDGGDVKGEEEATSSQSLALTAFCTWHGD